MTTSMRLGLAALFVLGGVATGSAFAGCGSDGGESTPPPEDTGTDTGTVETAPPPDVAPETTTDTPTDTPTDTGPVPPDRKITVFMGAPDLPPQWLCLGVFPPDPTTGLPKTGDGGSFVDPISAEGPYGVPASGSPKNPSDWTDADKLKLTGFPFGMVMPLPVSPTVGAILDSLAVVAWLVDKNPAVTFGTDAGVAKDVCKNTWASVRDNKSVQLPIAKGTIKKGESWGGFLTGCVGGPTTTGECGTTGKNLEMFVKKLDQSAPDTKLGMQAVNLSLFPGATAGYPPSWGEVELYIQPMNAPATGDAGVDGGEAGADVGDGAAPSPTPAGTPVLIGGDKATAGLKYKDVAAAAKALDKIPGDPMEAILLVTKHGADPCVGTPASTPPCTTSVPIPLKSFLGLAMLIDPTFKLDVGVKGVLVLAGGPSTDSSKTLRVMMSNAKF